MKQNLFVKFFCLSVIILLIGVSYSSAVSSDEIAYTLKYKKYEDIYSKEIRDVYINRINRIGNRLEHYKKIFDIFSMNDQVIEEIFEELSYKIMTLNNMDDNNPICGALEDIYLFFKDIVFNIRDIYIGYQQTEPLKAFVINILAIPFAEAWLLVWVIGYELNCWNDPF